MRGNETGGTGISVNQAQGFSIPMRGNEGLVYAPVCVLIRSFRSP